VWRSAQQGFTLVELMVVIAIIGFVSAAAILSIPDPRGRLVDDADRFAARLAAVRDHAVIAAQPAAVWVSPSAYGFERYEGGQWQEGEDGPFRTTSWRSGTQAVIGGNAKSASAGRLMLAFDTTGLPSEPARVTLERGGEQIAVTLDGAGRVSVGD